MTDYSEGFAKFVREREKAAEAHAEYGRALSQGPWLPPEMPDEVVLGSKPPRVVDEDATDANVTADKARIHWNIYKAEPASITTHGARLGTSFPATRILPEFKVMMAKHDIDALEAANALDGQREAVPPPVVVSGKVVGPISAPRDTFKEMVLKRRDEVAAEIQRGERPPVTPDAVANAILARLAALPESHPARLKYEEVRQRLMDEEIRLAHESALLERAATHFASLGESARLAPSVVAEWLRGRIWEAK